MRLLKIIPRVLSVILRARRTMYKKEDDEEEEEEENVHMRSSINISTRELVSSQILVF